MKKRIYNDDHWFLLLENSSQLLPLLIWIVAYLIEMISFWVWKETKNQFCIPSITSCYVVVHSSWSGRSITLRWNEKMSQMILSESIIHFNHRVMSFKPISFEFRRDRELVSFAVRLRLLPVYVDFCFCWRTGSCCITIRHSSTFPIQEYSYNIMASFQPQRSRQDSTTISRLL